MRLLLVLTVPALAVLAAALAADKKDSTRPADSKQKTEYKAFDAAEFLRAHDRDKDGFLTRAELPRWMRHHFQRLDANKDGKISKDELEKGARYVRRHRPSDILGVLVEMSDCDECAQEEVQRLYETLRKLDRNNDGKIDVDELKAGRETAAQERVTEIFEDLDADKDGKISKEEARGQLKKHFADLDSNNDGFIDGREMLDAVMARPAGTKGTGEKK